jgi:hypothetical protein
MCACVHVCVHVCGVCVFVRVFVFVGVYVHVCVCVHVYIYIYICVCVFMCAVVVLVVCVSLTTAQTRQPGYRLDHALLQHARGLRASACLPRFHTCLPPHLRFLSTMYHPPRIPH